MEAILNRVAYIHSQIRGGIEVLDLMLIIQHSVLDVSPQYLNISVTVLPDLPIKWKPRLRPIYISYSQIE